MCVGAGGGLRLAVSPLHGVPLPRRGDAAGDREGGREEGLALEEGVLDAEGGGRGSVPEHGHRLRRRGDGQERLLRAAAGRLLPDAAQQPLRDPRGVPPGGRHQRAGQQHHQQVRGAAVIVNV